MRLSFGDESMWHMQDNTDCDAVEIMRLPHGLEYADYAAKCDSLVDCVAFTANGVLKSGWFAPFLRSDLMRRWRMRSLSPLLSMEQLRKSTRILVQSFSSPLNSVRSSRES